MRITILTYLLISVQAIFGQTDIHGVIRDKITNESVPYAMIMLDESFQTVQTADEFGRYYFKNPGIGYHIIQIKSTGFEGIIDTIFVQGGSNQFDFYIKDTMMLNKITVYAENAYESRSMHLIEGMTLTHGKKTHLINIDNLLANKSTNNARELYARVPGLNIWESDGGGLQLGIGSRGLSPNRTAHFNTRQNGYDISADALGYPETYYTPPSEAISSIQIIKGAASLQFGPQFGGMINFDLIKPSRKKFEYVGSHTYGAYNYYSTFNSISGTLGQRFSYLGYYKYKQGDGWRTNAGFHQHNAFGQLKYQFTENMYLSAEYTYMSYLAQQPGGLTDALFNSDPRQSIRERNWFAVSWNTYSINYNWEITKNSTIDVKFFRVDAGRKALGNLDKISRLDDYKERNLIDGKFNNWGTEFRYLQHYPIGKTLKGTLAGGLRYYSGTTTSQQGLANDGYGPDFYFLNPENLEGSSYSFPSQNASIFAENMIRLKPNFWISAGLRVEYIKTSSSGYYREQVFHPLTNALLFDTTYFEVSQKERTILLGGLGFTWKIFPQLEIYGNIAQNYRGINFSDIRISNPNQVVDPNITDEKGFNADLGYRGKKGNFVFDAGAFFMYYNNKIGIISKKINDYDYVRYRTNIGKAYSSGIEFFGEFQFRRTDSSKFYLSAFVNTAFVYARYGELEEQAYSGNQVELVPPITAKSGIKLYAGSWSFSFLVSYIQKHFTDGTNATFDANAVAGIIPSYYVMDYGMQYNLNKYVSLKGGVNNLTNNRYFTRRASAYPGPGIIPSDGISFYLTLGLKL